MKKQMRKSKDKDLFYPVGADSTTVNNVKPLVEQLYQQIHDLNERLASAETKIMHLKTENLSFKEHIRNLKPISDTCESMEALPSGERCQQSGVRLRTPRPSNKENESDHTSALVNNETSLNVQHGVPVRSHYDETWNAHFLDLQQFKAKFGHMRVSRDYNKVLCAWVLRQRRVLCRKKREVMDKSRLHALGRIGFHASEDNDSTNKGNARDDVDDAEQIRQQTDKLQAFPNGIIPKDRLDKQWNMRFMELRSFRLMNGHCRVPPAYSKGLASWTIYQRQLFNGTKRGNHGETIGMDATRIAALTSLGMEWRDGHKARHPVKTDKICHRIPKRQRESKGDSDSAIDHRRSSKRPMGTSRYRLPPSRAQSSDLEQDLTDHIVNSEGHDSSPACIDHSLGVEVTHNDKLDFACKAQKTSTLTPDTDKRTSHEDDIAVDAKAWESSFRRLKRFKLQKGHLRVAVFNDRSLFIWMNRQRKLYRGELASGISKDRIKLLNSIGFDW